MSDGTTDSHLVGAALASGGEGGAVDTGAGKPPPRDAPRRPGRWTPAQVTAIQLRADALGYRTPTALARAVGVSHATILRWFSGERGASMEKQEALARALELPWPTDFLGPPAPAPPAGPGGRDNGPPGVLSSAPAGRYTAAGAGVNPTGPRRDMPVYRAGSRADPAAPEARAAAEDEVALLEADARVLGTRGFGIRVVDESLSHWTVARGDVLWFDPDWPVAGLAGAPEEGVLVAALLPCGELAARVLRRGELVTDGADAAEGVPFDPERYRGRNVGRMKPIDRPRRLPTPAPEGGAGPPRFLTREPVRP